MIKTVSALLVVLLLTLAACQKKDAGALTDLPIGRSKDLTLSADIELPTGTQRAVIKIKGDRARTDIEALGLSTIQSPTAGVSTINHHTKTIEKQKVEPPPPPASKNKDELARLQAAFAMKFTGRTETIAGWTTREFLIFDFAGVPETDQTRGVAWIADDFPEGRDIQRLLERVIPNEGLASLEKIAGKRFALPGFALRTEMTQGSKSAFKITYTAIRRSDLDDNDFELPKDYLQSLTK